MRVALLCFALLCFALLYFTLLDDGFSTFTKYLVFLEDQLEEAISNQLWKLEATSLQLLLTASLLARQANFTCLQEMWLH